MTNRRIAVKISGELADRLAAIAKKLGYKSKDEFVKDVVRRFIETLGPELEDKD